MEPLRFAGRWDAHVGAPDCVVTEVGWEAMRSLPRGPDGWFYALHPTGGAVVFDIGLGGWVALNVLVPWRRRRLIRERTP